MANRPGPARRARPRAAEAGGKPRRIRAKRIYDEPGPDDGVRVLVDRVWPRGVSRERARLDRWAPGAAPSPALRRWFGHDPERFAEFRRRYRAELAQRPLDVEPLLASAACAPLTLLYAARDPRHNHAVVLAAHLTARLRR